MCIQLKSVGICSNFYLSVDKPFVLVQNLCLESKYDSLRISFFLRKI
jgi:sulfopyruvate decarboxylase TPP-binding subunit